MGRGITVDRSGARKGALVALAGLVLLVVTPVVRAEILDADCATIANPDGAHECVAASAQTIGELTSYGSQGRTYVDATDVERLSRTAVTEHIALPKSV